MQVSTAGEKNGKEILGNGSSPIIWDVFGITVYMKNEQASAIYLARRLGKGGADDHKYLFDICVS
jgi:hypothetical protein